MEFGRFFSFLFFTLDRSVNERTSCAGMSLAYTILLLFWLGGRREIIWKILLLLTKEKSDLSFTIRFVSYPW